ncbi:MAG TPA: hypothetical protein VGC70_06180 [Burkholderiales bacterium]|jgi:hypothetical protein
MTISCLRPGHSLLIVVSLAVALALEVRTGIHAQALISLAIWGLLLYLLMQVDAVDRRVLLACLVIATAGEIFLSLVWGLYTYRLHNIPPFVPPGHVLLLMLGIALAQRISKRTANAILMGAGLYAMGAAATGVDTLALPLLAALIAVSLLMPAHRQLYASTFMLSLVLELYGTWLGNWTWAREVPVIALVTTNPPGIASAFYAVLDALVALTAVLLARCMKDSASRNAPADCRVEAVAHGVRD